MVAVTLIDLREVVDGGVAAGALSATAGGGAFVSLPLLVHVGLSSTLANASSTVDAAGLAGQRGAGDPGPCRSCRR